MKLDFPTQTIFYTVENAIKQYRKMSQKEITSQISDITIDQALILLLIDENPDYSQVEIAEILFKDYASITRMIELMVANGYLERKGERDDKRRAAIEITAKGKKGIVKLLPIIKSNRERALKGINTEEVTLVTSILQKIIANCS